MSQFPFEFLKKICNSSSNKFVGLESFFLSATIFKTSLSSKTLYDFDCKNLIKSSTFLFDCGFDGSGAGGITVELVLVSGVPGISPDRRARCAGQCAVAGAVPASQNAGRLARARLRTAGTL